MPGHGSPHVGGHPVVTHSSINDVVNTSAGLSGTHAACQHHNTYELTVDSNVLVEYGPNGPAASTAARTNPAICAQCSAGICGVYASTRSCISRTPSGTVPQVGCGLDRPVGGETP
jgi:hypothetical protein